MKKYLLMFALFAFIAAPSVNAISADMSYDIVVVDDCDKCGKKDCNKKNCTKAEMKACHGGAKSKDGAAAASTGKKAYSCSGMKSAGKMPACCAKKMASAKKVDDTKNKEKAEAVQ